MYPTCSLAVESEEDEELESEEELANPYPLDGKYIDEEDRQR